MLDVYCVLSFEDEKGNELTPQFCLPYAPNFILGQVIHIAESVDKSFVASENWNTELELHKDYNIVGVNQSFEHRYMRKMSTHHYVTLIVKEFQDKISDEKDTK